MPLFDKNIPYEPYDDSLADIKIPDSYSIVGIYKEPYQAKRYIIKCSNCDSFPHLSNLLFSSGKAQLKKGHLACGCSSCFIPNEEIMFIKVTNECILRGYEFLGFSGEYSGSRTKLKLKCIKHNCTWDTTSIETFFAKHGCYLCGRESTLTAQRYSDSKHIEDFKDAGIINASFTNLGSEYWKVECHECGKQYKSSAYHLKEGKRGCSCSNQYKRSKEEFISDIYEKLESVGNYDRIISFTDEIVKTNTRVILLCSDCGNTYSRLINTLLAKGVKCDCARHSPQLFGYINVVWDGEIPLAFKFGVESSYLQRTKNQNNKSPFEVTRLLTYKFETPNNCNKAESKVKETLKNYLSRKELPDGFTETCAPTENNLIFIKSIYTKFGGEIFE